MKRGRLLSNYLEDTEWNYLNEPLPALEYSLNCLQRRSLLRGEMT
jgi:hypothetical protein